jgi:hypothetical protein
MDQLTFLSEAPPASRSASPVCAKDWMTLVATWPSNIFALLTENSRAGLSGKTQISGALAAEPGMKQQTYIAYGFKAGQGAKAGSIGLQEEISPTLGAADSGSNRTPVILKTSAVRASPPSNASGFKASRITTL